MLDYHWMDGECGLVEGEECGPDKQTLQHLYGHLHAGGGGVLPHLRLRTVTKISKIYMN